MCIRDSTDTPTGIGAQPPIVRSSVKSAERCRSSGRKVRAESCPEVDGASDCLLYTSMAAFISYPQDKTDHTFSVYVNRPDNLLNSATYALSISKHEKHGDLVFFDCTIIHDNMKNMEQIAEIHKSVMDGCKGFFMECIFDSAFEFFHS